MSLQLLIVLFIGLAMGLTVGAAAACASRKPPTYRPRPADTLARRAQEESPTWKVTHHYEIQIEEECQCDICREGMGEIDRHAFWPPDQRPENN